MSVVCMVVGVLLGMASAVVSSSWAWTQEVECLWRIQCDRYECKCYDDQEVLSEMPCADCTTCVKKHEAWSSVLDDIVPLSVRNVQISVKSRAWGSWMPTRGLVSSVLMVFGVLLGMARTVMSSCGARSMQAECFRRVSDINQPSGYSESNT